MAVRVIIQPLFGRRAGEHLWLPAKDALTFGRDLTCTVVFPSDLTAVAPLHLVLLRTRSGRSAEWVVGPLNGQFVAVDGKQVDTGATLPIDCKIELGHLGGASFMFSLAVPLGGPSEERERTHKTPVNQPLTISELQNRRSSAYVYPTALPRAEDYIAPPTPTSVPPTTSPIPAPPSHKTKFRHFMGILSKGRINLFRF